MGDFTAAMAFLDSIEGGWVHDPDDPGLETYRGITRRDHPSSRIWVIFDEARARRDPEDPPLNFNDRSWYELLDQEVRATYRARYWDAVGGDRIEDNAIATKLFEVAVNMGTGVAVGMLQRGLNLLNKRGVLWPDLERDAQPGPRTMAALSTCIRRGDAPLLRTLLGQLQAARYIALIETNPTFESFARGWLRRAAT